MYKDVLPLFAIAVVSLIVLPYIVGLFMWKLLRYETIDHMYAWALGFTTLVIGGAIGVLIMSILKISF